MEKQNPSDLGSTHYAPHQKREFFALRDFKILSRISFYLSSEAIVSLTKNTGDMKTLFREIDNFASIYHGWYWQEEVEIYFVSISQLTLLSSELMRNCCFPATTDATDFQPGRHEVDLNPESNCDTVSLVVFLVVGVGLIFICFAMVAICYR